MSTVQLTDNSYDDDSAKIIDNRFAIWQGEQGGADYEIFFAMLCIDEDGDGYGSPASESCEYPEWDCNDSSPSVNPGMSEIPDNGIDDNCNGQIDEQPCFIGIL